MQRRHFPAHPSGFAHYIEIGSPVYVVQHDATRGGYNEISRSKNLRGLVTAARRYGVNRVAIYRDGTQGAWVYVEFEGKACCYTMFADYSVACAWFARRAKRWGIYRTQHDPDVQRYSPTH